MSKVWWRCEGEGGGGGGVTLMFEGRNPLRYCLHALQDVSAKRNGLVPRMVQVATVCRDVHAQVVMAIGHGVWWRTPTAQVRNLEGTGPTAPQVNMRTATQD